MHIDEETIFAEALRQPTLQARSAFLDRACAGDIQLRSQVEALLIAHDRGQGILYSPLPGMPANESDPFDLPPLGAAEQVGSVIGNYKLLQQIGEGGMGAVFMAEQLHPVRRTVALKIIKPGLDTKQVIARFEAERQALAMMDHPNIAKVLDAGATDAGRSFFVMELVRGIPLTEYCDQNQLNPRQRLELFVQVCQAVQHAHTKGIIHRDLKPSNVLVTLSNDKPTPKIIDFGIAKATAGQRLTERTLVTELRQLIGTPLYMSPEQAEMSAVMDVDTRSDVYSLGVLLYELLTGTTPFDKHRLAQAAYDEVRRIIREEDPPRPSTRLSTLGETLSAVSAQRQTDPKKLGALVRGELDWIVMRAMEKDRARRYETANGLARDVERYLNDQTVEACPPSRRYRLRKFARRNKSTITAAGVILAVLVVATSVSIWQAVQARRASAAAFAEKRRADEQASVAEAVNEFLNNDVLGQASIENQDAAQPLDRNMTVRDALDRAAATIEGRFDKQPLIAAAVRRTIGCAYQDLGENSKAREQLEKAVQLARQSAGNEHKITRNSMFDLAEVYTAEAQYDQAEGLLQPLLETERRVLGEHKDMYATMNQLAVLYATRQQFVKAVPLFEQVSQWQRRSLGEKDPDTLIVRHNLGTSYTCVGRYAEAEPVLLDVLKICRTVYGEDHPTTLATLHSLGKLYLLQDQFAKAEPFVRAALEGREKVLGELHPETLASLVNFGSFYFEQARYAEAEPRWLECLARQRKALGAQHPSTLLTLNHLGMLYERQRQYDAALPYFAELYQAASVVALEPPQAADFISGYGVCLAALKRYPEAEIPLREAYKRLTSNGVRDATRMRDVVKSLKEVCDATGRAEEAAKWRAELAAINATTRPTTAATTTSTPEPP